LWDSKASCAVPIEQMGRVAQSSAGWPEVWELTAAPQECAAPSRGAGGQAWGADAGPFPLQLRRPATQQIPRPHLAVQLPRTRARIS
jgi:hypothetical protein